MHTNGVPTVPGVLMSVQLVLAYSVCSCGLPVSWAAGERQMPVGDRARTWSRPSACPSGSTVRLPRWPLARHAYP